MGTPIWLIASSFEPRGSSLYTLRLASELPEHGFSPVIICQSARYVPARYRSSLDIVELPHLLRPVLGMMAIRRLLRERGDQLPELIHGQRRTLDEVTITLAERADCPYLLTVHDYLPPRTSLSIDPERLAAIIAVSPSVRRDLVLGASVPADLIRVIPSGVDVPLLPRMPAPRSTDRVPIVGAACALEPAKGLTYFLMAAELILSSGQDAEFVIAGTGPEEETLRRVARHLDIANRVTFVDYIHEYASVLETFDLFVNSSLEQGLGTIMLEAMARGKPVVATQVGGVADFFAEGEHLLFVPSANHVLLAERIQELLDNPERARRLALAGQQLVRQQFSTERMARETAELYDAVLAAPVVP